jgi:hypothetical protein
MDKLDVRRVADLVRLVMKAGDRESA